MGQKNRILARLVMGLCEVSCDTHSVCVCVGSHEGVCLSPDSDGVHLLNWRLQVRIFCSLSLTPSPLSLALRAVTSVFVSSIAIRKCHTYSRRNPAPRQAANEATPPQPRPRETTVTSPFSLSPTCSTHCLCEYRHSIDERMYVHVYIHIQCVHVHVLYSLWCVHVYCCSHMTVM